MRNGHHGNVAKAGTGAPKGRSRHESSGPDGDVWIFEHRPQQWDVMQNSVQHNYFGTRGDDKPIGRTQQHSLAIEESPKDMFVMGRVTLGLVDPNRCFDDSNKPAAMACGEGNCESLSLRHAQLSSVGTAGDHGCSRPWRGTWTCARAFLSYCFALI